MKVSNVYFREGQLCVHVDVLPSIRTLAWTSVTIDSMTYYMGTDPSGYAFYFVANPRDRSGFGGQSFVVTVDGVIETVVGPWSSNTETMNRIFNFELVDVYYPQQNIYGYMTLLKAQPLFEPYGRFVRNVNAHTYRFEPKNV